MAADHGLRTAPDPNQTVSRPAPNYFGDLDGYLASHRGTRGMNMNDIFAEATLIVGAADTANRIALAATDEFPEVFATSRMIALMEVAAARAMQPLLSDGQLSVGVSVDIRHTAATAIGGQVRATARWLHNKGQLMVFRVEAFDEAGLVGEGEHTRAIVDAARLLAGAARRGQPAAGLSRGS
jgi:fluoroacetyl-CoA thioesterase